MKITLESTSRVIEVNGIPARIWEGKTDSGIEVVACITRIAVPADADQDQFQRELAETRAPTALADVYPMRLVL